VSPHGGRGGEPAPITGAPITGAAVVGAAMTGARVLGAVLGRLDVAGSTIVAAAAPGAPGVLGLLVDDPLGPLSAAGGTAAPLETALRPLGDRPPSGDAPTGATTARRSPHRPPVAPMVGLPEAADASGPGPGRDADGGAGRDGPTGIGPVGPLSPHADPRRWWSSRVGAHHVVAEGRPGGRPGEAADVRPILARATGRELRQEVQRLTDEGGARLHHPRGRAPIVAPPRPTAVDSTPDRTTTVGPLVPEPPHPPPPVAGRPAGGAGGKGTGGLAELVARWEARADEPDGASRPGRVVARSHGTDPALSWEVVGQVGTSSSVPDREVPGLQRPDGVDLAPAAADDVGDALGRVLAREARRHGIEVARP
jgi:hypothetical protein